jgi:cytochrome c551/c552
MKILAIVMLMLTIGPSLSAAAEQGETIFKSQGCTACHRVESSSKVNPSLTEIARAYSGKADQLVRYLNGETDALVKPEKSSMMKRYLQRTQKLSGEDRQALADFIMSHQ